MYIVGLTGGIGSGKSVVTDYFQNKGIDVIDADIIARQVVEPHSMALQKIAAHFGDHYILGDGNLNRAALRKTVFDNHNEKMWLENLLHPLIRSSIIEKIEQPDSLSAQPYQLLVSPLLLETDQHQLCHRVVVVDVTEGMQIERASARDNNDKEQIKKIIAAQMSRTERLAMADDIINNDGSLNELEETIDLLHTQYLSFAKEKKPE